MRTLDGITIRMQVALATAGLAILLVLGATLSAAWLGRGMISTMVRSELAELAVVMAARLDRGMAERYREIGTIVDMDLLRPVWENDVNALRDVLDGLQRSFTDYAWIGFARADGTVVAATKGMLEGQSVAQRPWFVAGKQKPFVGDVHEAVLLAKLLGPRADAEPFRFVDVAYPVRNATGDVIGVLGAHLSWDWATDIRRSLISPESHFAQADVSILDEKGKVLLGRGLNTVMLTPEQLAAIRAKPTGSGLSYGTDADEWLTGYALGRGYRDYPGLGWIIVARLPATVANAPVRDLVGSILAVGTGLGIVSLFVAWWLANRLTKPIRRLTEEADKIGREAGVYDLPRVGGALEVSHLSRALRSLLRRIGMAEQLREAAVRDAQTHAAESRELSADVARLRHLSETDPLTGLLNRRAFLSNAERLVAFARRYGRDLAVVVADIDHFKRVNDTYGHAAGDAVIKDVARRLQGNARDSDLVARFGGEEFVVLLMESDVAAATAYAERVRIAIQDSAVALEDGRDIKLTLSLGCTILQVSDRDVQDVIDRADGALYTAKTSGRNRVRMTAPGPSAAAGD